MSGTWTGGRRSFLQKLTAATSALSFLQTASAAPREIPKRVLGRTGLNVTMLGFGAAWLGLYKDEKPAVALGLHALELGINFFDTARDYGVSEERLGKSLEGRRKDVVLMTKVLSRGRGEAEKDLETSLKMLRTDYLDVWQIHSVQTQAQLDRIFGPDGALEAAVAAQKAGKVRFIGVTGHKDPSINLKALSYFDFDTIQTPLNLVDPFYRSFEKGVLPEAVKRKMGVLAMKSMAGGWIMGREVASPQEALHYVWSLPMHVLISGVKTIEQLDENAKLAREFKPMKERDKKELLARVEPEAGIQTEYYKMKPDGSL